jgi:hypothetical protein
MLLNDMPDGIFQLGVTEAEPAAQKVFGNNSQAVEQSRCGFSKGQAKQEFG